MELNQRMTEVCRLCVKNFVEDRTDKDGRVSIKAINKFAQMAGFNGQEPWNDVLKVTSYCGDCGCHCFRFDQLCDTMSTRARQPAQIPSGLAFGEKVMS